MILYVSKVYNAGINPVLYFEEKMDRFLCMTIDIGRRFGMKKICILGLGYIGLPTAAMFATHGHRIIGVDIDSSIVKSLNMGKIRIEEPYLDILVHAAVTSGNLRASERPEEADVFIIAVPTPLKPDKTADMSYVISAARSIVPFLKEGNIIILESTSPPGTVNNLLLPLLAESGLKPGEQLLVAHSPERVMPGRVLIEMVDNNRIIGGINRRSAEAVKNLYKIFVKGDIYLTDATTAEMCKLMENSYRDLNIAISNELAILCENIGINAWEVIKLSNMHPRVNLHQPGPGVGGHCLAVDPWFIVEQQPELSSLIKLGRETNDRMPGIVFNKAAKIVSGVSGIKKAAILGITYKPNIDDIRESPIIKLVELFEAAGWEIALSDPHVKNFRHLAPDPYTAASGSHILILGVNHDEFSRLDYDRLFKIMALPNILDTRNYLNEKDVCESGINYYLLGSGKKAGSVN